MSACTGCDVEANGRIGHSQSQIALTGGLQPAKTSAAQTETSTDSLSFVDSWQVQLAALEADSATVGRGDQTRHTTSLVRPQKEAGANTCEVPNKDGLNLISGRSEPTQIVANAGTIDKRTTDARVTSGELALKRVPGSGRSANRHRSVEESIKPRKPASIEGPIPTPVVPAGISLPAPTNEPLQNSVSLENTGGRAYSKESVLNTPATIGDLVHSNLSLPLAEHAGVSLPDGPDSKTSAAQEARVAENFQADFSAAIQESKNARAANETRDAATGDIKNYHGVQDGAVVADPNVGQSTGSVQMPQASRQSTDSTVFRTTNNLIRTQSLASRSGNIMQAVAQPSSGAVQTIPQPRNRESARAQQTLSLVSANELCVPDRKTRRPGTVFGFAMQRQELDKLTPHSMTESSVTDSTRPLHLEVISAAAIAPARNHTPTPDRPSIQETMNALDASAGTDSGHVVWTLPERMHAEAGYQDPVLGWVGVRAEVSNSALHATVVPQTSEAAQALGGHIAGLHTYLSENHIPVETISLAGFGGSAQQSPGQETGRGAHHGTGDQAGQSNVLESTPDLRPIVRSITNSVDQESPLTAAHSSTYISVIA